MLNWFHISTCPLADAHVFLRLFVFLSWIIDGFSCVYSALDWRPSLLEFVLLIRLKLPVADFFFEFCRRVDFDRLFSAPCAMVHMTWRFVQNIISWSSTVVVKCSIFFRLIVGHRLAGVAAWGYRHTLSKFLWSTVTELTWPPTSHGSGLQWLHPSKGDNPIVCVACEKISCAKFSSPSVSVLC
jgi:hypothetical protein